jgi:glycosyltransferase involved in cell wall biosynthesis
MDAVARLAADSDVLIAWGLANLGDCLAGLPFRGRVVFVSHGACSWTRSLLATSAPAAHHCVAVSRAAAAPFGRRDVTVLHNGADADRCRQTRHSAEVRAQWGASPTEVLVGYVGRFSWEKNPLAAARAAQALGPGHRAVYVGTGWQEAEVKRDVLALAPDTIFVPPVTQIGDALCALDALVLASPSEGFSLALCEAWLCGLPTVATRVGAVPELEDEYGSLVVPVPVDPTPSQLGQAIRIAFSVETLPTVERARHMAWKHFTAEAMAARWTRFLTRVHHDVKG